MRTYQEIVEKKLNKVGKPGGSIQEFERDAHSQGIDLGKPERDAHHINYPNARFRKGNKPVTGTLISGELEGNKFHSQKHTAGNTLRKAVKASGRKKPNTPKQKEEIKKQAAINKARKQKNRDPFTREETMPSYSEFLLGEGRQAKLRAARKAERERRGNVQAAIDAQRKFADARKSKEKKPEMPTAMDKQRAAGARMRRPKPTTATQVPLNRPGGRLGGEKETMKSKQRIPNTIKKPPTRNTPSTKPQPTTPKEKRKNPYVSGLKSSLGGDVLSKNELDRRRARRELGRKTGRAIRSAPGKVVSGVGRAVGGALKANDAASQGNFEGQESGQLSGGSRYIDRTKQS